MQSIRFELTRQDWEAAQVAHLEMSPANRRRLRISRTILVGIFAIGAILGLLFEGFYGALPWAIAMVLWALGFKTLTRFTHRRLARRIAKEGVMHGIFGPHEVRISEEGLADVTPVYEVRVKWSGIDRVTEASGNFLVYTGAHSLVIIPASAFQDSNELRSFGAAFFEFAVGSSLLRPGPHGSTQNEESEFEWPGELVRREPTC